MSIRDDLKATMVAEEFVELTIRVRARIIHVSDSHGLCFAMALDKRDYGLQSDRTVYLDEDEIISVVKTHT